MDKKEFGIFTPYSIMLYSETNTDNPVNFLKRNAILFENLVIVPQGIGPLDGNGFFTKESYLNAYSKETVKNKKELGKILLTIEDFVNNEDDLRHFYSPRNPETSMWLGENSSNYIDFIMKYVQIKNGYDKPEIQSRDHKKELEGYIGNISMDFQILAEVTRRFDKFSGLYSEIHEQAFTATYGQPEIKTKSKRVITALETINYFDFGSLSWDEIIVLRKSHFADDFRKKIWEWTNEFNSGVNNTEVEKKIGKFIDDAKFEFIEKRKPRVLKSSLTGILGNIPLPIPVNPISIGTSIEQVVSDKKVRREFGWLLFIQRARKKAP